MRIKWFAGCAGCNRKTFSRRYKAKGIFTVCFVKFETVCSIPQEQVVNETLDSKQIRLRRNVCQGEEKANPESSNSDFILLPSPFLLS